MNMIENILLISPDTIKASNMLDCNVDDSTISSVITTAQNIYLKDIIGDKLLYKLQELIYNTIKNENNNLNDEENSTFKKLLDIYIKETMTYKVLADLTVLNTFKIKNAGVVQLNDTNINSVSLTDIKYLKDYFETYYNSALNNLMNFLNNNKVFFKDFINIECNDKNNKKYGNINLYLGK